MTILSLRFQRQIDEEAWVMKIDPFLIFYSVSHILI